MAVAAAVASLSSFSPLSPSSLRTHSSKPRTLALPIKPLQLSFQLPRRPLKAAVRIEATHPQTINGDDENQSLESENEAVQNGLPTMKAFIQAYKKAVLDGDEKSVSELEAAICIMENEKNKCALKFSELAAEKSSGKDKLLRLTADFENFRKRSEKDRLKFASNIQGELIESLLPMIDSFESSKQHLKPETEKEKTIDASYQGIYKQFVEIMRSLHVSVVGTVGKPFDPSIHEAVSREESKEFKVGIVTQEVRRGFVLGDRLLRPASVKVSSGPGPGKVASPTKKSSEQPEAEVGPVEDAAPAASNS